ncbi:carbohydrate ABC transporter permease [Paenibacillus durus]|uniref:Sugar ABC transporter permease n=1 Tax=Paenibacillus durus ATCC 35681 TaxID=1333534 RepID=A0A0F7FE54_PAEDU|nr:carbohydrate ABC transporter permease [Paenibacillus durus]AKG37255.1 sugar ABC transporter permease [Paenibacillus durus ATCC 35681]
MKKIAKLNSKLFVNVSLAIIVLLWVVPTAGLLVTSFRSVPDIMKSPWWNVMPHKEWKATEELKLSLDTNLKKPIKVGDSSYTDKQLKDGIEKDGVRIIWGDRRSRIVAVQEKKWVPFSSFTLENYKLAVGGKNYDMITNDGKVVNVKGVGLLTSFWNTVAVSVPATVIPLIISAFAAYALAWLRFPGKNLLFITMLCLLVVPMQVALSPIISDYKALGLNGTYLGIWLAHTAFALPFVIYFMYGSISRLPKDLFESAFMDGAAHFTIFKNIVVPLIVPVLASMTIFQFLAVWNDYLISLIFLGAEEKVQVLSLAVANLAGTRGNDWHLLSAGAFVAMIVPLIVFFSMQKYFIRGLLGGSVKG